MGFEIAPALIIFLVIIGAGGMVVCGFAVFRFYGGDIEDESSWNSRTPEQDAYMREVRERNWGKFAKVQVQNFHGPSNRHLAHAPMSPSANSNTTYG
ncbi:hypothetical protein BKA66DRAFT_564899 [Pyrenochaeta sp. MPI-SDFR-AT-0127]|nr:hypothetical protein BKA66DRAFT_564899 [Pyrenochaeta sp. MPI-SDFR-AT-0127]